MSEKRNLLTESSEKERFAYGTNQEVEITKLTTLLKDDGTITKEGFAKKFLYEYNKEVMLKLRKKKTIKLCIIYFLIAMLFIIFVPMIVFLPLLLVIFVIVLTITRRRIKEWEYYLIHHKKDNYAIAFTIADLGLMSVGSYVFLDFKNNKIYPNEEMAVLKNLTNLPRYPAPREGEKETTLKFNGKKIQISLVCSRNEESKMIERKVKITGKGKNSMNLDVTLYQPIKDDTIVIATSWKEDRKCFYLNQKVNCMKTVGKVTFKGKEYEFKDSKDPKEHQFACLDYGKGIWTYFNTWYWSSISGTLENGDTFGWNLGYGFSDRTPASENMLFYNGVGHKIKKIKIEFQENGKDKFMKPWTLKSVDEDRLSLTFTPTLDRFQDSNFIVLRSLQHQVFGHFDGYFVLDDGKKIEIKKHFGMAEEVLNKW